MNGTLENMEEFPGDLREEAWELQHTPSGNHLPQFLQHIAQCPH